MEKRKLCTPLAVFAPKDASCMSKDRNAWVSLHEYDSPSALSTISVLVWPPNPSLSPSAEDSLLFFCTMPAKQKSKKLVLKPFRKARGSACIHKIFAS